MITRYTKKDLDKEFDILIIGGGINGCGIARDAALRGLSVLLLEKEDFGYGCTSASTRLIHGGLRYLEYFEFGLVKESLDEREILLKNACHLVKPLELCIPIYKCDKRSKLEINLGLTLYDLFSFGKSLPSHKLINKKQFEQYEPGIKSENLMGSAIYYDAQVTYPERICIENIIMAEKKSAIAINHAEVIDFNINNNKILEVIFVDKLANKTFSVKAKEIINVSGPWVDNLCTLTNKKIEKEIGKQIGGTKGSHIIIKKFPDSPKHAIYTSSKSDNRPFFIIPWNNLILIGTTDTHFNGALDNVQASIEEKTYLINETNNILKNHKIKMDDILYSYAGVRPLPYVSKSTPGSITRKHIIHSHKEVQNFTSIIGGKLTTYRSLAEQTIDIIMKKLNLKFVKCKTKEIPYLYSQEIKTSNKYENINVETIKHLKSIYGEKYKEILDLCLNKKEYLEPISDKGPQIIGEVIYSFNEKAYTISDIFMRRIFLIFNEDLGISAIDKAAKLIQENYGLSDHEINEQIKEYKTILEMRND